MPYAVDESQINPSEEAKKLGAKQLVSMDPAKPPVKPIPFLEYPRVVYKHPKEPFKTIEHRNAQHEIVHVEHVPSEHLSKVVADKDELAKAMKEGWVKEPYIAPPLSDPNAGLYDAK